MKELYLRLIRIFEKDSDFSDYAVAGRISEQHEQGLYEEILFSFKGQDYKITRDIDYQS